MHTSSPPRARRYRRFAAFLGATVAGLLAASVQADPVLPSGIPSDPAHTFNITAYGASTTSTDNTTDIQNAINACTAAGGGTIVVPPTAAGSTYLSGPLIIQNSGSINFQVNGDLQAIAQPTYLATYGEGTFITFKSDTNVELTGTGTIDGQGGSGWWGTAPTYNNPLSDRPDLLRFSNVGTVLVGNTSGGSLTLENAPMEHVTFSGSKDVDYTIDNVNISAPANSPNTDGIDPVGSNFLIENCSIADGDDNIAVKPQSEPVSNITVESCSFGSGHGLSVGGETQDGLNGLTVESCTFNGTEAGIRLKAGRGIGGISTNLSYSNITMNNVTYPIYVSDYYTSSGDDEEPDNPASVGSMTPSTTTPYWRNISITNLTATNAYLGGIIYGLPEAHVGDVGGVLLNNVNIQSLYGMELYYVDGVTLAGGSVINPEIGPEFNEYDATVFTPEPTTAALLAAPAALLLQRRRRSARAA